jgi:hypothetical protein
MAYNGLALRPHLAKDSTWTRAIANRQCWHFDAWLLEDARLGVIYVRAEARAGGRELLWSQLYAWSGSRLNAIIHLPDGTREVTLQDKALWPRYDELNALHWRHIVPMSERVPNGYRSRSVALHYVRAPSLEPLEDGVANWHRYGEK